ncbi:MAG: hypothetical protein RL120_01765 [Gammaproteobacteria bacterium]
MKSFSMLLLFFPVLLLAQPATYRDGVLNIPEAAVTDPDDPAYFTDVQLQVDGDGALQIVAAEVTNPVTVEDVTVLIMESFPVQVSVLVAGYKSVPCVNLLTPAVDRKDNVFTVVMAESVLGPAESCIAVVDPFEVSVPLEVLGLSAGIYTVNVNGVTAAFTLDMDNIAPQ